MVAKSVKWALVSLVVFPPAAFALGLGDVRLLSSLNAPLDAEIELVGATPEELGTLKAQIATRDTFARYGLDWPAALGTVTLTPQRKPDGKEVIRLRTSDTITEPFLTLLVEVNWARGRLVREYTMLLDPPVFAPGSQQSNTPVAAPATGNSTREGAIARGAETRGSIAPSPQEPASSFGAGESPSSATSAPPPSSSVPSSSASENGGSRTVRAGETLSGIASEVSSGDAARSRAYMLAIYQANPAAFEGNMNVLRSGAVLRIPEGSAVSAISPNEAGAEIRRQYTAWRATPGASEPSAAEPGRLRLVPPAEAGAPGANAGSSAQSEQLQGRVRELESQLQESKRLLDARNSELAQLQARLSAKQGGQAATPPPAAVTPPPAAVPEPAPPVAETPAVETPPAQAATPADEPPAAAAEPAPEAQPAKPARRPATEAPVEGPSLVDTLMSYWWLGAALLLAVLAFFGFKAFRSRQRNEFDDSLSRLAAGGADSLSRESTGDTQPLRTGANFGRDRDAFVVEESGTHERPRFGGDMSGGTAPRNVNQDETMSSETAINLDQGDPLAEADFHMAYGLYDQAADLVRIAISREPDRRDLRLKLLEVFFVWGNKEQFLQAARELAQTRDQAASGEWEKIVIMGKQLAPEDPLFAGSGAGGGSSSFGGMDLDLEGGQSRVDFDLLGEPVPQGAGGVDLDIGSALGEQGGSDGQTVTDSNLALHEDGYLAEASTATTRQMTQKIRGDNSPTVSTFGTDYDAPTVEQPAYSNRGDPTVRQKVEMAMRQGGNQAEQTAELAIDDLGLDLGALDTMDQPSLNSTQEAPTLVAGLDERSRRIMSEAERRGFPQDADATAISSTGSWNLSSDEDDDATMPPQHVRPFDGHDPSETASLKSLKGKDLDFDFNDEDAPAPQYTNGSGSPVDLDVGTVTVPDTAFTATQKLNSEDLALPDMEPVTMSEVGTKLDLARAYMDMGDPEGARNILEEVLTEGSVAQKQEASRLLESLPG